MSPEQFIGLLALFAAQFVYNLFKQASDKKQLTEAVAQSHTAISTNLDNKIDSLKTTLVSDLQSAYTASTGNVVSLLSASQVLVDQLPAAIARTDNLSQRLLDAYATNKQLLDDNKRTLQENASLTDRLKATEDKLIKFGDAQTTALSIQVELGNKIHHLESEKLALDELRKQERETDNRRIVDLQNQFDEQVSKWKTQLEQLTGDSVAQALKIKHLTIAVQILYSNANPQLIETFDRLMADQGLSMTEAYEIIIIKKVESAERGNGAAA